MSDCANVCIWLFSLIVVDRNVSALYSYLWPRVICNQYDSDTAVPHVYVKHDSYGSFLRVQCCNSYRGG